MLFPTTRPLLTASPQPVELHVAVANGLSNAKKVLDEVHTGRKQYDFVEVMACPGTKAGKCVHVSWSAACLPGWIAASLAPPSFPHSGTVTGWHCKWVPGMN